MYTQLLPAVQHELERFRSLQWLNQISQLPILIISLEHIVGLYKSNANATGATTAAATISPLLTAAAPSIASTLQALLMSLTGTLCAPNSLSTESIVCVVRLLFACFQCEPIGRCLAHTNWLQCITSLKRLCEHHSSVSMRSLLGDVLVAASALRIAPPAFESFFTTLRPLVQYLLTGATDIPDCIGFDSFYRISVSCTPPWTDRLKELIPPMVHSKLVAYVKSHSKAIPTSAADGPTSRPAMVSFAVTNTTKAISAETAAKALTADAERLELEHTRQTALLEAFERSSTSIQRREQMFNSLYPTLTHADTIMRDVHAELTASGDAENAE